MSGESEIKNIKIGWIPPPGVKFSKPLSLIYWEPLFEEFQKSFPKTYFFSSGKVDESYKKKFKTINAGKIMYLTLKKNIYGYPKGFTWTSPRIIFGIIKLRPDLMILNGSNGWTVIAIILKKFFRYKTIYLWDGGTPNTDSKKNKLRLKKWIIKHVDKVIPNSQFSYNYLINFLKIPSFKVEKVTYIIPIKRNTDSFKNTNHKLNYSRPIFLYVGQIIPRKGLIQLLHVWSKIEKNNSSGTLIIVGEGSLKNNLEDLSKKLCLERIKFLGNIENQRLTFYYKSSTYFILPSLEDTWGVVTLEAMNSGTPVLISKYSGSCEIIKNGVNGFVFDPLNQELFYKMLQLCISNQGQEISLGKNAKHEMELITHNHAVDKFKLVIKDIFKKIN